MAALTSNKDDLSIESRLELAEAKVDVLMEMVYLLAYNDHAVSRYISPLRPGRDVDDKRDLIIKKTRRDYNRHN